jgi:hypothetical protein
MPGYGIASATEGGGLLPWEWARERLERSQNYWVATAGPDGTPHLAAVWGVWHDDSFWFSTGGRSRKARNLARQPRCSIAPESAAESVVVEGIAVGIGEEEVLDAIRGVYDDKYGESFPDPDQNPVFRVDPTTVIGMIETEPDFSGRATRWTFASDA